MTKTEIYGAVRDQLSRELSCEPGDFLGEDNVITGFRLHEKRRRFSEDRPFLQMATFGSCAVISADEKLHPWLSEWIRDKRGFTLFEQENWFGLETELRTYGYRMASTHHMFLPRPEITDITTDINIKWYEQGELDGFYGKPYLSNALCDRFRPERPDVLAVAAFDGGEIMGMAGCSADTPELWQIGIDVLPGYRRRGVAVTLVTLLKNEALRRGAIPYYGTSLSNLASWKTALLSGFEPAWIETEAVLK